MLLIIQENHLKFGTIPFIPPFPHAIVRAMSFTPYSLLRPLLFALPAESAHSITLKILNFIPFKSNGGDDPSLKTTLGTRTFPNPIGLAAWFDKNAAVIAPMLNLGFGFVETGTVTPRPQNGNPKPRIFRDIKNAAIINRMGFPNLGCHNFKANLELFLEQKPRPSGLVGINIGMNKNQTDPTKDYIALVQALGPFADYLTVNISSPNTPGLRDLQAPETFRILMEKILHERDRSCGTAPPPLLVKLAPDLSDDQLSELARTALDSGVDGLILTNTTLDRPDYLPESFAREKGGLSGKVLHKKSTRAIHTAYSATNGQLPIIGAGGVDDAHTAYEKIKAGASLVQLYSALAFKGPGVVKEIKSGLIQLLQNDGFAHVGDAVGVDHR